MALASVEAPVFLATLLAHLVVEFVWQDGDQLRGGPKAARWVSATLTHAWRVCVLTALPASAYGIRRGLELAVIVTAAHLTVDLCTAALSRARRLTPGASLLTLGLDQALHLGVLWVASRTLSPAASQLSPAHLSVLRTLVTLVRAVSGGAPPSRVTVSRVLLVVDTYVAAMFAGAAVVRRVLDASGILGNNETKELPPAVRSGRLIGILERAVVVTLVLSGAMASVAVVVAAKSVARFSELNNRQFAEYYLVGTLTSVLVAITLARLAQIALGACA